MIFRRKINRNCDLTDNQLFQLQRLVFQLGESDNDWFWAIDDVRVVGEAQR